MGIYSLKHNYQRACDIKCVFVCEQRMTLHMSFHLLEKMIYFTVKNQLTCRSQGPFSINEASVQYLILNCPSTFEQPVSSTWLGLWYSIVAASCFTTRRASLKGPSTRLAGISAQIVSQLDSPFAEPCLSNGLLYPLYPFSFCFILVPLRSHQCTSLLTICTIPNTAYLTDSLYLFFV